MAADNYAPDTARTAYFPGGSNQVHRLWSREKLLHDLADLGIVEFFEGVGDNPTGLSGYAISKLWLRPPAAGVTTATGTIRAYGGGDATLLASWPVVTKEAFAAHIGATGTALDLVWSAATSGDPGTGKILANHATLMSATVLNISKTGRQGQSYGARIAAFDDSTTLSSRGTIVLSADDGTVQIVARVTGAVTDNGTWTAVPVAMLSATAPATGQLVSLDFFRTGDSTGQRLIDVRQHPYNATGDGTTDDLAAINAAIAVAVAGDTIYFPRGTYALSASASTIPAGVRLLGDGRRSTILKRKTGAAANIYFAIVSDDVVIERLAIDGDDFPGSMTGTWASPGCFGIYGNGAQRVVVRDCEIKNTKTGIRCDGAQNWRIETNLIHHIQTSGVLSLSSAPASCAHNIIAFNEIHTCGDTAVALSTTTVSGGPVHHNLIAHNMCRDTQLITLGFALDIEGATTTGQLYRNAFIGNIIQQLTASSAAQGGINVGNLSEGHVVLDNTITLRGSSIGLTSDVGIQASGSRRAHIANNSVSSAKGPAIGCDGSTGAVVQGNTVRDCGDSGGSFPAIQGSINAATTDLTIDGNVITYSTGYLTGVGHISIGLQNNPATGNIVISNNVIRNTIAVAIQCLGDVANRILGLTITGNTIAGMQTTTNVDGAIYIRGYTGVLIANNNIRETKSGIRVRECTKFTVRGNLIADDRGTPILAHYFEIADSSSGQLVDNVCRGGALAFTASPSYETLVANAVQIFDNVGVTATTAAGGRREPLTANRTYYVRTDGSDANTGLVNNAGGAFLTIQKAIDVAVGLDLSIYSVTIQVADGTYTGAITLKSYIGVGPIRIRGNTTTPANVVISTSGTCIAGAGEIGAWRLGGLKLTSSTGNGMSISGGTVVNIDEAMDYGASAFAHAAVTSGAKLTITANYTISGAAAVHLYCLTGAFVVVSGVTVTVTGTPNFSLAFASFSNLAGLSSASWTFSGSATGKRYDISLNAVINTAGGGANFFPGDSAGTTATGGQYA